VNPACARSPGRILVRGPNWLGDVVMSTPGLRALRQAHPEARIVVQLPAPLVPLLAGLPGLDEVWPLDVPLRRPATLRREARRIAAGGFDLGVVIPESISSALLMRAGRVGHVVGHARDPLRRGLLHQIVPTPPEWGRRRLVSRERFVLGLMAAVGAPSEDVELELAVTAEEERQLAQALRRAGWNPGPDREPAPIVLAPGASYGPSKCWPVESYAALADTLLRRGERVVLVGTGAERARVEAVTSAMRVAGGLALAGVLDLGALKALLRRARLLVCNDAGARHVAVALGTPAVVFFGPTAVAKTAENLALVEGLETEHGCRPCYRRHCPIDHRCLASIDPDEALVAVDRRLGREAELRSERRFGPSSERPSDPRPELRADGRPERRPDRLQALARGQS